MIAKTGKLTKLMFQKKGKKGDKLTLRVVGLNDEMLDGKKPLPEPEVIDKTEQRYFRDLHILVDHIFMEACELEWTWSRLAEESGLAYTTVDNLGMKRTKRPQFRTVYRMAEAVGYQLVTQAKPRRKSKAKVKVA